MKYSYIARQPILDRERNTVGYELLFRDGPNNTFPQIDAELATSRLLSDHFWSVQYRAGKLWEFVNFPYQSLINLVPTLFPSSNLVVEVLEGCTPTEELLKAIIELKKLGYTIALDDFVPSKEWAAFLPHVQIIKFDIHTVPIEKARLFIKKNQKHNIQFLAEKVETYQEFELAKQAGFCYFQGYFFSQPALIQRKALEPAFLTIVQLCKEISKEDINYQELGRLISKDLTLSYKLLTFVNSSVMVSSKIRSFKQALVYLGETRLRRFVSLVAIASTHKDKPDALYGLSIQRARYCELLSLNIANADQSGNAFLTGMFSLIDGLLDQPLADIIEEMPIEQQVKDAIVSGTGQLGKVLQLIKAYEQAEWQTVNDLAKQLSLAEQTISDCYHQAVHWTADLFNSHQ